jgi:hypothetical protein
MSSPTSIRFDATVAERLARFVAGHRGLTTSAAANLLVDEALRTAEHPLIVFRDGPAGRRARLVGGPDVWEVVQAVRSARAAEPSSTADAIVEMVSETSGIATHLIRATIDYWSAYPDDVDAWLRLAEAESAEAERRWRAEQYLLAG